MNSITGFLLVAKPKEISSYDCIRHIKRILSLKTKIGHTGTLDTFASGLLIIALGRSATRLISKFADLDKIYQATAKLGELTDTLDCTGKVISQPTVPLPSFEQLLSVVTSFPKAYPQRSPIYSALKYKGTPLYHLARTEKLSSQELMHISEQKTRLCSIYHLHLDTCTPPLFTITAHVSKGTYIRSLMNDIAVAAGSYATTYELTRTHIGPFALYNAVSLDQLVTCQDIMHHLISSEKMIECLSSIPH